MEPDKTRRINKGDLLVNLLLPRHIVEYIYIKDKMMFLTRWIREVLKMVKNSSSGAAARPRKTTHMFLPAGSRTSSLRTPSITVFDDDGHKIDVVTNDMDQMITHPDLMVGNEGSPLHLEFVEDPDNVGYGKVIAKSGVERMPELFARIKDADGNAVDYLRGDMAIKHIIKDRPEVKMFFTWDRSGPAFEHPSLSTEYKDGHKTKVDIVGALLSAKDYFKQDVAEVMANSSWSDDVKEAVIATPNLFVRVAPKTSEDDGMTWRLSFSMHELVVARSFDFDMRQVYTTIRYIIKYLLSNAKIPRNVAGRKFSSYLILNAFFTFCDESCYNWEHNKMAIILNFLKYFAKCLADCSLPQYFYPKNNLLREMSSDWCKCYSAILSFSDEAALIDFIIDSQTSWRMPQFERSIKPNWSGGELTLREAKSVLKNISIDAFIHLETIRVVQAWWSNFEIYESFTSSADDPANNNKATGATCGSNAYDFWHELFVQVEFTISGNTDLKAKYVDTLKLMQKMAPHNDTLEVLIQKKLKQYDNPTLQSTESDTYYKADYKAHGEIEDCVLHFNKFDVRAKQTNDDVDETFVFPYTNHLLLYSEPLHYFLFCDKSMKRRPTEELKMYIKMFLDKKDTLPTERNPIIRLTYILKEAFSKDDPVIYDLNAFKV